jgi:hypothetical protein
MDPNAKSGQLFSSGGAAPVAASETAPASYQPAKALPGEGVEYDALQFDMAAAGFEPIHWTRPAADLRFAVRQPTLPEMCRAVRLLPEGSTSDELGRLITSMTVTRIGDRPVQDEDEVIRWLDDLRSVGADLVGRAVAHLCHPSADAGAAFEASKRYDPQRRAFDFAVPRSVLPKKTAAEFSDADLSFSMRELTFRELNAAADACDDPDDSYAVRALKIMWSISAIGGKALDISAADLLLRRRWLARVGHPAWLMIAGTHTRMHEVDRGLVDRFLGAAVAPA